MKSSAIIPISALAGFFLFIAGLMFFMGAVAPGDMDAGDQIARLAQNRTANFVYVASVYLCYVLIIPIIVLLTIHLYPYRPIGAVFAGTLLCLGGGIEMAGTLASLSQWVYVIPEGLQGNAAAIGLFQTLTLQFLLLDFGGVALVYVAAIFFAILLWRVHRLTCYLLLLSVFLLLIGIPLAKLAHGAGAILPALSIMAYAAACPGFGLAVSKLSKENSSDRR
jgi:hypothetical protein